MKEIKIPLINLIAGLFVTFSGGFLLPIILNDFGIII